MTGRTYKHIALCLWLIICGFFATAQNIREQVYLHLNSQDLITGETLYYSAYCHSDLTGKPSQLSTILYVELIGEKGVVHQDKIKLTDGHGQGELFLSSLISTGKYQLLAYTRWMKNFGDLNQTALTIVNPYEEYQHAETSDEALISFYPNNGEILVGVDNTVAFRMSSTDLKGKIVNDEGETILDFATDKLGFGLFRFRPEQGNTYQVILEDKNANLTFVPMPEILPAGTAINLSQTRSNLDVTIDTWPQRNESMTLSIKKGPTLLVERQVRAGSANIVSKDLLTDGLLTLTAHNQTGLLLARRSFFNGSLEVNRGNNTPTFQTRENATIRPVLEPGTYSVSVRKSTTSKPAIHSHSTFFPIKKQLSKTAIDPDTYLSVSEQPKPEIVLAASEMKPSTSGDSITMLPEVRDELISGTLKPTGDLPVSEVLVTLAFPQAPYQLRSAMTNARGEFTIPFNSPRQDAVAFLAPFDFKGNFIVQVDDPFLSSYPEFDYNIAPLDSSQILEIVDRSIRNQIQNAYYQANADEEGFAHWHPQLSFDYVYVLDEYTRFKTIRETFTEYIISTSMRTNRDPVFKAYVASSDPREYRNPTLVLLDGVPISGAKMIDYSPYKIESVGITNNRYFNGPLIADGVVSFTTKEGMLNSFELDESCVQLEIMGVSEKMTFSTPDYSDDAASTVPDLRDQLLWQPELQVDSSLHTDISFFTSDVTGKFEMVIEGFTNEGKPVSVIRNFVVEKRDKI
ncbi:MAG: hypothetical protein ABJG41_14810 [Cyclobacteriaceae bacterium]